MGKNVFCSYENIIKNSKKLDPWNTFIIKKFSKDGEPLLDYISASKDIFRTEAVLPYTKKFNPELLI
jgi:hypothetical protein